MVAVVAVPMALAIAAGRFALWWADGSSLRAGLALFGIAIIAFVMAALLGWEVAQSSTNVPAFVAGAFQIVGSLSILACVAVSRMGVLVYMIGIGMALVIPFMYTGARATDIASGGTADLYDALFIGADVTTVDVLWLENTPANAPEGSATLLGSSEGTLALLDPDSRMVYFVPDESVVLMRQADAR